MVDESRCWALSLDRLSFELSFSAKCWASEFPQMQMLLGLSSSICEDRDIGDTDDPLSYGRH
jgi:hypothetical protein